MRPQHSQSRAEALAARATVAIVTALPKEIAAMEAMLDDPVDHSTPGRAPGEYVLGEVPSKEGSTHAVVVVCSSAGEDLAAAHLSVLLERFPRIESVLMVGIAGAAPDPTKPEHDVRLCDIVVSDSSGVKQYDFDKETFKGGVLKKEPRFPPRPPGARLLNAVAELERLELSGNRPWEGHLRRGKKLKWTRLPTAPDELHATDDPSQIVARLSDPNRRPKKPMVFRGPIASANKLLKNAKLRDELRDTYGVKAVEMEAAGVADAAWLASAGYLVIRGTCDYCDEYKCDPWQGRAALVAAAYARAVLERTRSADLTPSDCATIGSETTFDRDEQGSTGSCSSDAKTVEHTDSASQDINGRSSMIEALRQQAVQLSLLELTTNGTITALGAAPDVSPPVAPSARAPREDTTNAILGALRSSGWVAIHGTSGSGKSELARQVSDRFAGRNAWIALRDLNEHGAATALVAGLIALARSLPATDRTGWYERICANVVSGLIVLDDLPHFHPDGPLGRELCALAAGVRAHGTGLITTSPHELPARLATSLTGKVTLFKAPDFTGEETQCLLKEFGAPGPASVLDPWARFINGVTGGHAELVVTAAAFLRQREWRFAEQELKDLLGRNFSAGIQSDVLRRIVTTVSDESARELLFRASLVVGQFTHADFLAIAESRPSVRHPLQALAALEGIWVQVQGTDRFAVCPLVKGFESELDCRTRQNVHETLGLRIMRRGTIGPIDVMAAITHFVSAEQFERAGVALLVALSSIDLDELPAYDAGLFDLWANDPLPAQMSRAVRIYVRTLQIAVHEHLGRDASFLADDLLSLAERVADEDISELVPLIPQIGALSKFDFGRTNAQLLRVLRAKHRLGRPNGEPFQFPDAVRMDSFLWHQTSFIQTEDDATTWLNSVSTLDRGELRAAAGGVPYEIGCLGFCDRLWWVEANKKECERNWESIIAFLTETESKARELGLDLLAALAQRAQVTAIAEYKKDFSSAESLALDAIRGAPDEPRISFLLRECLGREYLYVGRHSDAVHSLKSALAHDSSSFELTRLYAQLSLSQALSATAPIEALTEADKGVALARVGRGFPQTELVKALSEAAIATHRAHGPTSAFARLDEAASLLFASRTEATSWKDLTVLFAHTAGFLRALAATGRPPSGTTTDGEEFAEPQPGIFLKHHSERHKLFTAQYECLIYSCMAMFADTVGDEERLSHWQEKGRVAALVVGQRHLFNHLNLFRITQLVAEGDHPAAIRSAAESQGSAAGILQVLLSLAIAIADTSLDDVMVAARDAQAAAKLMASLAAASTERPLWDLGARVLKVGFDPTSPTSAILDIANEPTTDEVVRSAARLIASVRADASPVIAAGVHINFCMTLLAQKQVLMQMHRRLLLPFLSHYWNGFAARSSFLFRSPAVTKSAILEAGTAPVDIRAQKILREVVWGLGAKCAPAVSHWLNSPA